MNIKQLSIYIFIFIFMLIFFKLTKPLAYED